MEPNLRLELRTSALRKRCTAIVLGRHWWGRWDSNPHSPKAADLQSDDFTYLPVGPIGGLYWTRTSSGVDHAGLANRYINHFCQQSIGGNRETRTPTPLTASPGSNRLSTPMRVSIGGTYRTRTCMPCQTLAFQTSTFTIPSRFHLVDQQGLEPCPAHCKCAVLPISL